MMEFVAVRTRRPVVFQRCVEDRVAVVVADRGGIGSILLLNMRLNNGLLLLGAMANNHPNDAAQALDKGLHLILGSLGEGMGTSPPSARSDVDDQLVLVVKIGLCGHSSYLSVGLSRHNDSLCE
jgi:hypothetical protein